MRRALLTIPTLEIGGMQEALARNAGVLRSLGWQVDVLEGLERPAALQCLDPPDVVVSHSTGWAHDWLTDVPVVERVSLLRSYRDPSLAVLLGRSRTLTHVIVQSDRLGALVRGIVPGALPVTTISSWVREVPHVPDLGSGRLHVAVVARAHPVKNLDAVCLLADACTRATFEIVSPTSPSALPANARWIDGRNGGAVAAVLRRSNLYLSLSAREGESNAALRAFARGLPAVLTDGDDLTLRLHGNAHVVEAWSVAPACPDRAAHLARLAGWIDELADDPDRWRVMSEGSRQVARASSFDAVRERWQSVLAAIR